VPRRELVAAQQEDFIMRSPRFPSDPRALNAAISAIAIGALVLLLTATSSRATGVGVRGAWVDRPNTDENTQMVGGFFRLGGVAALEGAVDYRKEDLPGSVEVRTWPVTASLVVSPIPVLYGLAGVGWYNTTIDFPSSALVDDRTQRDFGWHVGAGTQVPIMPSLSFLADLRYAYINYDFDEFAESVADFDGGNYLTLNLGLMLGTPL
jgi:hypothetical protein